MGTDTATSSVEKTEMREFIVPALSLVVGIVILLPTAIGPVTRPLVYGWLLPTFIFLALLSIVALGVALVVSGWKGTGAASRLHKAHGIGNFSGVLSLIVAAAFLVSNYYEDGVAPPQILNVKINPVQPEAGKIVEVDLELVNRTNGPLTFFWELDGRKVGGLRTAYIKMPEKPGTYKLTVSVRPDESFSRSVEAGVFSVSSVQELKSKSSTAQIWLEVAKVADQQSLLGESKGQKELVENSVKGK